MELRPHQQKALDNVNEIFEQDNKAIVVHPTATGKTYIVLELFAQNKDKKMVFVSPSVAIIGQLKVSIAKEFGTKPDEYKKVFPNLEITTYQQINSNFKKNKTYAQNFDAGIVVFDEAHHTAATEWGKNAKTLMNLHPETKFLGLTATPQRPDGIDVTKDVFDGNLADEITLEEAVATGLLKIPNYVTALYSYEPLIEELELELEAIQEKYPEKYLMLKKDMNVAKKVLEKSHGLPEIFAKHMTKKDGKYVVFCKDIEHLTRMVESAKRQGWFDEVNDNVEILQIHSEEDDKTNAKVLKRFRDKHLATDDTLRILFSVDKINEGLHLDDIAGEIMLRPTRSKILYRQQLGRAMTMSSKNGRNVVFDIVDNIDSFDDIKDFIDEVRKINGNQIDSEKSFDDFYIADEAREARDILRSIAGQLEEEWEEFYKRSVKWREEHNGKKPNGSSKDKNERTIYDWEKYQKLKYLKDYQYLDEKEIPEEYTEKVKKLKAIGLEYVHIEYKTIEEWFIEWKVWTIENKLTPSQKSKDEEEIKIARGMKNALTRAKKTPEQYKKLLEEYNEIYSQYGRRKDKKTFEEWLDEWKVWTIEHEITPSSRSKDNEERKIAQGMQNALTKVKKTPEQYKELLEEYNKLCSQYGRKKDEKTFEEWLDEWKAWTIEHEITPSTVSKDEDERKIAQGMRNAFTRVKKTPKQYKELLEEYNKLCSQYGRKKDEKTFEEWLDEWKVWTIEHEITPSPVSKDENERKIARRISTVISRMKKTPEQYKKLVEEYNEIYSQYGRKKDEKTFEEWLDEWKVWTIEHEITPYLKSKNEDERKIAQGISTALSRMRKTPEQYKELLEEYDRLYSQYGRKKDEKISEEWLDEWKVWTIEHKITPSPVSKDENERKIARGMNSVLARARKTPEQYKKLLEEYNKLYSQYGRKKDEKTFEEWLDEWKSWTIKHKTTPVQHSKDEDERKIAQGMNSALARVRKTPEQYKELLEEYNKLYLQYGRQKLKSFQQQKEEELAKTRELKEQIEQAEELDARTQYALDQSVDKQNRKQKGPGE